jgi:hypothetical protein
MTRIFVEVIEDEAASKYFKAADEALFLRDGNNSFRGLEEVETEIKETLYKLVQKQHPEINAVEKSDALFQKFVEQEYEVYKRSRGELARREDELKAQNVNFTEFINDQVWKNIRNVVKQRSEDVLAGVWSAIAAALGNNDALHKVEQTTQENKSKEESTHSQKLRVRSRKREQPADELQQIFRESKPESEKRRQEQIATLLSLASERDE